ncbi:hypothetical protein ACR0ST_09615 [Aliidiomarina sp. Khilg15.8]
MIWRLVAGFALLAISAQLHAEQLDFTRQHHDEYIHFSYQWQDRQQQSHGLEVAVLAEGFLQTPANFRALSPARVQREVRPQLQQFARNQGWHAVEIKTQGHNQQLRIIQHQGSSSERAERQQLLRERYQILQRQVIHEHYYNFLTTHTGERGYKPDHVRIARASQARLQPLVDALEEKLGRHRRPREALDYLLGFVQSIPYDQLDDRFRSPGAGFNPPTQLLYENRGDCDSKVTLIAALFNLLHPEIQSRILYLPQHAVLAVDIEPQAGDFSVSVADSRYLVADPTGPALMAAGEISRPYQAFIQSGALSSEAF